MSAKKILLVFAVLLLTLPALAKNPAKSSVPPSQPVVLRATPAQEEAGKYISIFLLQNHYRKVAVGDSLSGEIFRRYIENLDAGRNYFSATEIDSLKQTYATRIDDEFLAGRSDAGFAIYNFFLKRAREKMLFMRALADTAKFNFSVSETLDIDRKSDPWPSDRRQLLEQWRKELKYQWLNLKYSDENKKTVKDELIKAQTSRLNLLGRQKPEDAFQAYINAVATSFDPHTSYFSPDEYENFQIDMSRSLEGIGAKLQTENEYTVVNEVIPGGPAFRSKILK
ncbi:MAG: tail-specific protease, partial [Chlorobiaceae bacterium]|nr:tail-specific protease [Chlorobiaceae bacterium]NTV60358.1 tail-specific protease [Chlorobiaceae bacterium]